MNNKKRMWWQLGALGIATAALIAFLFIPIKSHVIVMEIPVPAGVSQQQLDAQAAAFSFWGPVCVIGGILAITAWIARRIVRHHKSSL